MTVRLKIKAGDMVRVLSGKERGKTGKVMRVIPKEGRVLVENMNMATRHRKPRRQREKGQRVSAPSPFSASNVKLVCPSCHAVTRVRIVREGGKPIRQCKKCSATI